MRKTLPAFNIQYPISQLILDGTKIVETRTYPVPALYLNRDILMIETPGETGTFKARAVAVIRFTDCYLYKSKEDYYRDFLVHQVTTDSAWAWQGKPKWGWKIKVIKKFDIPKVIRQKRGIKFTRALTISL